MSLARRTLVLVALAAFSNAAFVPCPGGQAAEATQFVAYNDVELKGATSAHAGHHAPVATQHDGAHAHHPKAKPAAEASQLALTAPCLCGCDDRDVTRNNAASPRLDAALADTRPTARDARPIAYAGELGVAIPAFAPHGLDPVPI